MDDKLNNKEINEEKNDIIKEVKPKKKKPNKDIKIIIVGDSGTGKTSLVNRYIYNKFAKTYSITIGSQFSYKIYKKDDVIYRVQFWDIAGQDKNAKLTKTFAKGSHGCVVMCDATNLDTRNE
jgi:small GTP-binding protein